MTEDGQGESLVAILDELADLVASARSMPMSASVLVNRAEAMELIESAKSVLPSQITRAQGVVADADAVLGRARLEASELVERAQERAEELVSAESVVAQAQARAEEIVADAQASADKLAREADDYCPRLATQQKNKNTANVANCVQAVGNPSYHLVLPKDAPSHSS